MLKHAVFLSSLILVGCGGDGGSSTPKPEDDVIIEEVEPEIKEPEIIEPEEDTTPSPDIPVLPEPEKPEIIEPEKDETESDKGKLPDTDGSDTGTTPEPESKPDPEPETTPEVEEEVEPEITEPEVIEPEEEEIEPEPVWTEVTDIELEHVNLYDYDFLIAPSYSNYEDKFLLGASYDGSTHEVKYSYKNVDQLPEYCEFEYDYGISVNKFNNDYALVNSHHIASALFNDVDYCEVSYDSKSYLVDVKNGQAFNWYNNVSHVYEAESLSNASDKQILANYENNIELDRAVYFINNDFTPDSNSFLTKIADLESHEYFDAYSNGKLIKNSSRRYETSLVDVNNDTSVDLNISPRLVSNFVIKGHGEFFAINSIEKYLINNKVTKITHDSRINSNYDYVIDSKLDDGSYLVTNQYCMVFNLDTGLVKELHNPNFPTIVRTDDYVYCSNYEETWRISKEDGSIEYLDLDFKIDSYTIDKGKYVYQDHADNFEMKVLIHDFNDGSKVEVMIDEPIKNYRFDHF